MQLAENRQTGEQVAVKFIRCTSRSAQRVIARELLNHRLCDMHPHIIQLREVFPTEEYMGIAMEFAAGGDLSPMSLTTATRASRRARETPCACGRRCRAWCVVVQSD